MRRLNPDHVERVIELVNQSPYFALINTRLVEMREGYSRAVADLDRKHQNAFGGVHGGAYASFVDCAAYWRCTASSRKTPGSSRSTSPSTTCAPRPARA